MADYEPIACSDYDMLEIACMDSYEVRLQLDDAVICGVVNRLQTRDRREYLWLRGGAGEEQEIRIDRIRTLTVLTRPARFEKHDFAR